MKKYILLMLKIYIFYVYVFWGYVQLHIFNLFDALVYILKCLFDDFSVHKCSSNICIALAISK